MGDKDEEKEISEVKDTKKGKHVVLEVQDSVLGMTPKNPNVGGK